MRLSLEAWVDAYKVHCLERLPIIPYPISYALEFDKIGQTLSESFISTKRLRHYLLPELEKVYLDVVSGQRTICTVTIAPASVERLELGKCLMNLLIVWLTSGDVHITAIKDAFPVKLT